MNHNRLNKTIQKNISKAFFLIASLFFVACDNSINPINTAGLEGRYSIYGTLNVSEPTNYIRVYDTFKPPTEQATEELNLSAILNNKKAGSKEELDNEIIQFEEIYTHNFFTKTSLDYNSEFVFFVEDEEGFEDSVQIFIPRKANTIITNNTDRPCNLNTITLNVSPINFLIGETTEIGVSFEWVGIERFHGTAYGDLLNEGFNEVKSGADSSWVITFAPNKLINEALGRGGPFEPPAISCIDENIDLLKIRIKHYGKPGFGLKQPISDGELISVNGKRVLGLYEQEFELPLNTNPD